MTNTRTIFLFTTAFLLGCVATGISGCQNQSRGPAPVAESNADSTQTTHGGDQAPDEFTASSEAEDATELSATDQPTAGEPTADQPSADSPSADSPSADQPSADSPSADQPSADQPSADAETTAPTADQPAASQTVPVAASKAPLAAVDKNANAPIEPGDWMQWGGTSYRNNTPIAENIPIDWSVGDFDRKTGKWIQDESRNIKWVAQIGSQTYGNPVVADSRIYVGTNNGSSWIKRYPARTDLGCLICFRESDGEFLWQDSSEKLSTGRVHDWPLQGICCAPLVEGKRLWYVTSRGEVKCVDTEGFHDGEDDGPVQNQWGRVFDAMRGAAPETDPVAPIVAGLNAGTVADQLRELFVARGVELPSEVGVAADGQANRWSLNAKINDADRQFRLQLVGPKLSAFKLITIDDTREADVVWVYDMMEKQQVSQHNMCSCSVTALGDILFVNTSNGVDNSHLSCPQPNAASFMAMDKNTGEVFWTDKSPGENILHGQWSSPTVAQLGGVQQVIFAAGDGWVYSFRADRGQNGKPELLWKFDANPKESKWILGGRGTRNNIIASPVVYDGLLYVAVGQDPEHGEGPGHVWCLDPTRRGDVSAQLAMRITGDTREPIPHRRLQAVIADESEVAVDNPNSAVVWHYDEFDQNGDGTIDFEEEMHRSCGTVAVKNDLVFIADFSGLFHCLDAKTGAVHWTYDMLAAAWGSPLIVQDNVYIGDEDGDVAIFKLSADPQVAMKKVDGELHPINADPSNNFEVINMGNSVYSTPIVANGVLYISNRTHLFAIAAEAASP